jgi:FtsH-binding integral membrane protein
LDKKENFLPKILKITVWVLIIASVIALYISLRSDLYSFEYGVIALVLWVVALGLNYIVKKRF